MQACPYPAGSASEVTVGKHTAADDSTVDPLVAAALAHHTPGAAQHEGPHRPGEEGEVGWPGDPREGEGLGWPAEPEQGSVGDGARDRTVEVPSAVPGARRGWRRLFGATSAA
jgi:hypothetical protein